jgi:hypothetical protein
MASSSSESVEQENVPSPVRLKRKPTYMVWNEFNRVVLATGELKAECVWCHVLFGGEPKYGTSHLRAHLATCASRQANCKLLSPLFAFSFLYIELLAIIFTYNLVL